MKNYEYICSNCNLKTQVLKSGVELTELYLPGIGMRVGFWCKEKCCRKYKGMSFLTEEDE